MPYYKIKQRIRKADEDVINVRVVEAKNEAMATKFIVEDTITVEKCSIPDAMVLSAEGVKLEKVE